MATEVLNKKRVSQVLPVPFGDTLEGYSRANRYGEDFMLPLVPTKHLLAEEGSYFVVTNPTPGTGIQLAANITAFADTNALFVIGNQDKIGGKNIFLDYLRLLLLATAPTATVSMEFAAKMSPISREPTTAANRTVLTPAPMNPAAGRQAVGRYLSYANAGAMTVPASLVSDPVIMRGRVPTGLGIAGDEYVVKFGGEDMGASRGGAAVRATDPGRIMTNAAPIMIPPGYWVALHMWWLTAATTAATFEFELGVWER